MPIEVSNVVHWDVIVKEPLPLIQAAARGGRGILRIQRQQNHLVELRGPELCNGFAGEGMPVAHCDKATGVESLTDQLRFQSLRLPLGETPDGRSSADSRVVMLHFTGARGRNQFGQWFATQAGKREIDDVGITEKIKKERLYRSQRIRPAELKQNNPHTPCCARHPPDSPDGGQCTPICDESQWRNCKMKAKMCGAGESIPPRPHIFRMRNRNSV